MPVWSIIEMLQAGWEWKDILNQYPFLKRIDIRAAYAYYVRNKVEIDQDIVDNNGNK